MLCTHLKFVLLMCVLLSFSMPERHSLKHEPAQLYSTAFVCELCYAYTKLRKPSRSMPVVILSSSQDEVRTSKGFVHSNNPSPGALCLSRAGGSRS